MRKFFFQYSALPAATAFTLLSLTNCVNTNKTKTKTETTQASTVSDGVVAVPNPLLAAWAGSYGGLPPFDKVKVEDIKPALESAMAENLQQIEIIANNASPATFENTIAAMEQTGQTLERVMTIYGIWSSNMNNAEFQKVEREMAPKLSAFSDQITQNTILFERIKTVYNSPEKEKLTPEQQRLTWKTYNNFVRAGASLDATAKTRLSELNQQLANLYTKFSQNLLADEMNEIVVIDKESDLAGLPQSLKDAAANAAAAKKMPGKWVITNTRSSVDPFLTYSDNRALREKAWRMFVNRGDNGGATDNNVIITEVLQLRAEKAKLLGYETHAHWRLENTMAKTPERAVELMEAVWKPAIGRVKEEVADMHALAKKEGQNIKIEPWDYRYYAEKVRKAKYELDQNEVQQYLQLENLREGMFCVAGVRLHFSVTPVTHVPAYHPEARVWGVQHNTLGNHTVLLDFDAYPRERNPSGGWMNASRVDARMDGEVTPIV